MAKNDRILLDGIIDDRVESNLPSDKRDEVFEYFAFEQLLKFADLSKDEIESGWVDGSNDGGIDGFFILINGHLLCEFNSFLWPKTGCELELWIITCKHHETFKQATLDNLIATITELLDFAILNENLTHCYSKEILNQRENLKLAYRKLSSKISKFLINFAYVSRGDTSDIGQTVLSRSEQIKSIAQDSFNTSQSSFHFYGSTELVDLHRKSPSYSLELTFFEVLSRGERYVLLAKLEEFYKFVSDEGKLRRYLFDSNVRDFMGINRVNDDINNTLLNSDSPDFWWLNNGITILATSASVIGKTIKIEDIQIVNGLQTTESIFRYFEAGGKDPKERSVLVKIIVTTQDEVRDTIIRATNNQTAVELASLHATDKIQRDIEEILIRNGLYYERRQNHYVNLGHPISEIITPLYLASGYVNLVLKSPSTATSLRTKFMCNSKTYEKVFSDKTTINVWPIIAIILKKTDEALIQLKLIKIGEKYLKRWRQILSFITVSKIFGKFDFSADELSKLDINLFTYDALESSMTYLSAKETFLAERKIQGLFSKNGVLEICKELTSMWSIIGIERVEKLALPPNFTPISFPTLSFNNDLAAPDMDFALKVNDLLPDQPWKPGLHLVVSEKLACSKDEYFEAVRLLIAAGIRHNQKDGVVYDVNGDVISFDPDRVNPETMELLSN